ncbi:MAG: ketol-acid reductoisomerase [Candidatus Bathyarchaeia archaeon]
MVKIYFDKDVDIDAIKNKTMAVIGYGSQGRAQAMNMRDSGLRVIVGLRPGGLSWEKAKRDSFEVYTISEAVRIGDIILMLVPDMIQPAIYKEHIEPNLSAGKVLDFAHGFNIHFKQILPPKNVDVIMVAPKSPGPRLRETFVSGFGVPALIAVHQDYSGKAKEIALSLAKVLGCTRAGVLETTFKDETESDLIGEQTVLVGGLIELIKKGFEVLVECGYPPELAYFEACNEAKLIMDLIYERGITGMLKAVSETARYGGLAVGPKVIDEHVKENMRRVAMRVRSGEFAKEWISEYKSGGENLKRLMKEIEEHPLEKVGLFIRKISGLEKNQ